MGGVVISEIWGEGVVMGDVTYLDPTLSRSNQSMTPATEETKENQSFWACTIQHSLHGRGLVLLLLRQTDKFWQVKNKRLI